MDRCDVIVVGGGIQGASMALAAARRGLHPLVLERDDVAAGATVNSFGIIHGGFRYLQFVDIARWRRSRQDQSWLVLEFPELVQPLPCIMPLYRRSLRSPALFGGAFALERILSRVTRQPSVLPVGKLLPADFFAEHPIVKDGLVGGALWYDAELKDARGLIKAILDKAGGCHRILRTGIDVQAPIIDSERIAGVCAVDRSSGRQIRFQAPTVILCVGSRSRQLAARFDRDEPMLSAATLAFNVLLDVPVRFSGALAISSDSGRGRSYLLRPFEGGLLAGTEYVASPGMAEPTVSSSQVAEFIAGLDRAVPELRLPQARVRSVWSGILPDCDGTGRRLRDRDRVWDHGRTGGPNGLYTILGTKLTTARGLSETAASRIWPDLAPASELRRDSWSRSAERPKHSESRSVPETPAPEVAIDAHVHIYDPDLTTEILGRAAANFARCSGVASRVGVLMLAESNGFDAFARLRTRMRTVDSPPCTFRSTAEEVSLWAYTGDWRLLIVAGRQIITAERLEVLALGTTAQFRDGQPIAELLDELCDGDAIVVLPWGVGKWVGRRGGLVARSLERSLGRRIFLGDNGGRPSFWPVPLLASQRNGVRVLAGTDPLPLADRHKRIATFGSIVQTHLSDDRPAADLKGALRDPSRVLRRYGKLERPVGFLRDQIELRLAPQLAYRTFSIRG